MERRPAHHPLVYFLLFFAVFGFTMFLLHPVCLLLSLGGALALELTLGKKRELLQALRYGVPLWAFTVLVNVLFNHRGATILCYFPNGNPLTAESLCYGAAAGVLLLSVLLWFHGFSRVMTSDQFVYLFSRVSPHLALLLSMTLRFVPQFGRQFSAVRQAQAALGNSLTKGRLRARIRTAFACFSIVVTWALEHAVETADSMKSRGYGLPGRTSYVLYTFARCDKALLGAALLCVFCVLCGCFTGRMQFQYAPHLTWYGFDAGCVCAWGAYALLCAAPAAILRKEARPWPTSNVAI